MEINNIKIIRSNRKSLEIQIKPDLSVTVRAPLRASEKRIRKFIEERQDWIYRNLAKMQERISENEKNIPLNDAQIKQLAQEAKEDLPIRVEKYADIIGVNYGRITIRCQKTRWGSCSAKGNLNFNCLLMLMPETVRDYVVIHELCHRKEMNHSKAFWQLVESVMPDYKKYRKYLKDNSFVIQEVYG